MITYNQICEKLGFDPINSTEYNGVEFATEDDNYSRVAMPGKPRKLTEEEVKKLKKEGRI